MTTTRVRVPAREVQLSLAVGCSVIVLIKSIAIDTIEHATADSFPGTSITPES